MASKNTILALLWLMTGWQIQQSTAQVVPCDDRLYLFSSDFYTSPTLIDRLSFGGENGDQLFLDPFTNVGTTLNGVGYNVYDQHIYGINPLTYELFRVDATGKATKLGVPAGLDTSLVYYAGTVTPNGRALMIIGRTKDTEADKKMYSITLRGPNYGAGYVSIICDWQPKIEDIAHHPNYGVIYGFDVRTKRLVSITEGGLVTSNGYESMNGIDKMGSLFFDADGNLYGYGGSGTKEDNFYKINTANGKIEEIGYGPQARATDGCSCPYRMLFSKTATPQEVLPCAEVTFRYHVKNSAGTAYTQIELIDTLPEGFTITALNKLPASGDVLSGIGSNILHINRIHILLGNNEVVITAKAPAQTGVYASRGTVSPLPITYNGGQLISDDPTDGLIASATAVKVIEQTRILPDSTYYLCEGSSRTLSANPSGITYAWSPIDTDKPMLEVTSPGIYTVMTTTACGTFTDAIEVLPIEPPFIDLGADKTIEQGERIALDYTTNAKGKVKFLWTPEGENTGLSCTDCPEPTIKPLHTATYFVTIKDENNCTASDTIQITVVPVREVFSPSAFSPNGDGINDIFYLQGKGDTKILYLRIFDRWGNLVFQIQNSYINDAAFGWDGTWKNKPLPAQSFIFVARLEFADQAQKQLSGEVTLLR